ncbi:unnamed protein product [Rotaria socialis]
MPKRGQERIRKYVSAGLAMQQRKQNDSETDWSSSSEINDTSSSASIQPSTASESKESKKHRRHRGLEKNLRDVLRYSLREGFEGISYTRPIPSDTCGRQQISPKFSERILGGFEAVAHSWPWQVLYEQSGTCGGTLIDENYVLTAAHCISTKDPSLITITAGIHNRDLGDVDESSRQKLQVAKIFVHPDWNADTVINDIALLRLAEPANFNEYVQPACLPGPDPKPDSEVVLIGWGAVETGGGTHHVLKQTQVRVIENCEHFWTDINKEKQICVRDPSLNSVVCNDENYVLTAAHCISTKDPSLITITAGIHNRDLGDVDESSRQKLQVAKIFVHPDWNADTVINDIALLRLAEPANFNEYVQPACLPGPDPKPDSEVVLIGWGAVETGGGTHHVLKQTQVRVIENCEHFWTDINKEKQICVRDPSLNSVVCNGDSGGPLLQEHSGQWVVEGVTSFGERECEMVNHNMPNVYTRVSAYLPWINGITQVIIDQSDIVGRVMFPMPHGDRIQSVNFW